MDTPVAVRRAAMDLLARREHGRVELERKLRKRGAPDELLAAALDRLSDEGLLSEARYLEAYIRSRSTGGHGPARIREELLQRGLAKTAVNEALAQSGIDWPGLLQELWQRRFSGVRPSDPKERAKQARFLAYRGFSLEMIGRLLSGRSIDD